MKKLLLLLAAATIAGSTTAQIPNAGFENWSNTSGYNTPDNWSNLNSMSASASVYTAEKGTPGNPGSSYLKLTSKTVSGLGVVPGIAATGQINTSTMSVSGGFPWTTRSQSLTGNWQYMAYGSDAGFIAVYLTKWNAASGMRDTVASSVSTLSGMVMSWGSFTKNLTYFKGFNPDSALIILSSSGATPVANSYLYVDNLAFSGTVATTAVSTTVSGVAGLSVFPNPASSQITISLTASTPGAYTVKLVDMVGRVVRTQSLMATKGQISTMLNTEGISSGTYLLSVNNRSESSTVSVTIQ